MKKMNNKGFSLVELIVVIAIMAVLIGVLAPQFMKYVEKSRESTDIQNLDTCVSAVRTYYADKDMATEVTISVSGDVFVASDAPTGGKSPALLDAGCASSNLKSSKWDSSTPLKAIVKKDGVVEYYGKADYYQNKNDKSGFEAITTTSSPSPSTGA